MVYPVSNRSLEVPEASSLLPAASAVQIVGLSESGAIIPYMPKSRTDRSVDRSRMVESYKRQGSVLMVYTGRTAEPQRRLHFRFFKSYYVGFYCIPSQMPPQTQ